MNTNLKHLKTHILNLMTEIETSQDKMFSQIDTDLEDRIFKAMDDNDRFTMMRIITTLENMV